MSQENVDTLKRAIDAFDRRDIESLALLVTSDFEWFGALLGSVEGGSYSGRDGMERYFADAADTWEEFRSVTGEFRDLDDRVLAVGRLEGRGKGQWTWSGQVGNQTQHSGWPRLDLERWQDRPLAILWRGPGGVPQSRGSGGVGDVAEASARLQLRDASRSKGCLSACDSYRFARSGLASPGSPPERQPNARSGNQGFNGRPVRRASAAERGCKASLCDARVRDGLLGCSVAQHRHRHPRLRLRSLGSSPRCPSRIGSRWSGDNRQHRSGPGHSARLEASSRPSANGGNPVGCDR
jgi:SnoaL-like domain